MTLRPEFTLRIGEAARRRKTARPRRLSRDGGRAGMLVAELDIRPELLAPTASCTQRPSSRWRTRRAATAASRTCRSEPENFTTIELKTNFLGTARDGTLTCIAKPAHLGRTTQVWDATVSRHKDGGTNRALPLHADDSLAEAGVRFNDMLTVQRVDHLVLTCRDVVATLRFYTEVLG